MSIQNLDANVLFFLKNILDVDLKKDIVFIKDSDFKYIYANEKFCEVFKVEVKDILGKGDRTFIYDEEILERCIESDKYSYKQNFLIHEEKVYGKRYRVLKVKINLGDKKYGVLCFAKESEE